MESKWTEVDAFFEHQFFTDSENCDMHDILESSRSGGLPDIQISASQGKMLQLLVRMSSASRVLEIGTLGGYSTVFMARALPDHGTLHTIELEPEHARIAQANFDRLGLQERIILHIGDARHHLQSMVDSNDSGFDFIFIDADKVSYPDYLKLVRNLTKPGTVIVADNIVRGGELVNPATNDENVRGVQEFCTALSQCPELETSGIQTVGNKGYDGWTISVVV